MVTFLVNCWFDNLIDFFFNNVSNIGENSFLDGVIQNSWKIDQNNFLFEIFSRLNSFDLTFISIPLNIIYCFHISLDLL